MKVIACTLMFCLCGCTGVLMGINCLDAKIEREPRKLPNQFELALTVEGFETKHYRYQCVQYYDSDCSVRGNHWSYRLAEGAASPPIWEFLVNGDEITIEPASCRLVNPEHQPKPNWLNISVNGQVMYIVDSDNGLVRLKSAPTNTSSSKEYWMRLSYQFSVSNEN